MFIHFLEVLLFITAFFIFICALAYAGKLMLEVILLFWEIKQTRKKHNRKLFRRSK